MTIFPKLRQLVSALGFAALVAGCASQPVFSRVDAAPGARIGIVNVLSPEVTNVHLGLTVFGTYDHRFANDWHLDDLALKTTKGLLEQSGYQVVDVSLDANRLQAIRDQDDQTNLNYSGLTKDWMETYRQVMDENHLNSLVVLREEKRFTGERTPSYSGYGVISAMGKIPKNASLFVSATADVIGGIPPHRSIKICYGAEPLGDPSVIRVDNFADIQMADLEPIRPRLESLLEKRLRFELASAGLLHEAPTYVLPVFPHP